MSKIAVAAAGGKVLRQAAWLIVCLFVGAMAAVGAAMGTLKGAQQLRSEQPQRTLPGIIVLRLGETNMKSSSLVRMATAYGR